MTRTPVLVVGAGPIGLALAGDLGWRGTACTLIESGDGEIYQARMDMVGIRTMEYCRRWGIVDWVEQAGYNRNYPQDCAWVTSLTGWELGREPFPAPADSRPPPESPQTRERCPQNFFDPVLARFAAQFPHVALRYRTTLLGFEEYDDRIVATVRNEERGAEETIEASYIVGCDGGSSAVRQALGIGMTGTPTLTYTTNAIFRCEGLEKLHDKKPGYRYIFIGPEGTWATLVAINGRDQWRFSIVGTGEKRTLGEEEIRRAIVRAMGRDFDFEILSVLPWVRRQLVADRYGTRRAFIAGDAAHLTSPTGGFGMNTGIQDSVNLAWKLAACIEGWGGARLLASYELECKPIGLRNVAEATGNLQRMLSPQIKSVPPALFETGPEGDRARKTFGDAYTERMHREWHSNGIHLGYMYEGSPVIVPDGTPQPPDEVSRYVPTARPGSRAPHAWLADGRSTLDLFGRAFVLLRFGGNPPAADGLVDAAATRKLPMQVVDIVDRDAEELYERRLVLVRPDGQVCWRSDAQPANALEVIDIIRGA